MLDIHNLTFVTRRLSRSRGGGVARVYTVPNGNAEFGSGHLGLEIMVNEATQEHGYRPDRLYKRNIRAAVAG